MTPVLAVINELKRLDPELKAWFVTDRGFGTQATSIMRGASVKVRVKYIRAGKFRRYHRVSFWRQLIDIPTVLKNIRDIATTGVGLLQSIILLLRVKPDVVFAKGGFVCLPLGVAARLLRVPLVIHDSDAHPGLTNRILSKWATTIATGAPLENYSYPVTRSHYVGIPVDVSFKPVNPSSQQKSKATLGLHDTKKPLVVVTGGGLGARSINRSVVTVAAKLLDKTAILHITGTGTYDETLGNAPEHIDYLIKPFVSGLSTVFAAADVVITRAGATTMSELAAMGKAVIIIPNHKLPGGQQTKNAEVYQRAKAAIVLDEDKLVMTPSLLQRAVTLLVSDREKRELLAKRIHQFAKPDAAVDMAALIVEAAAAHKKILRKTG